MLVVHSPNGGSIQALGKVEARVLFGSPPWVTGTQTTASCLPYLMPFGTLTLTLAIRYNLWKTFCAAISKASAETIQI